MNVWTRVIIGLVFCLTLISGVIGVAPVDYSRHWFGDSLTDPVSSLVLVNENGTLVGSGGFVFNQSNQSRLYSSTLLDEIGNDTNFSVSLWVMGANWSSTDGVFALQNDVNNQFYVEAFSSGGGIRSGVRGTGGWLSVRSSGAVLNNTWYHLVFVYAPSVLNFWLDGVNQTGSSSPNLLGGDPGFGLGASSQVGYYYSNEVIKNVKVFNRTLSSSEVAELYSEGVNGSVVNCTVPVADGNGVYQVASARNETWCTGTYSFWMNVSSSDVHIDFNNSVIDCSGHATCISGYTSSGYDNISLRRFKVQNFSYSGVRFDMNSVNEAFDFLLDDFEVTSQRVSSSGGAGVFVYGTRATLSNGRIHDVNNNTVMDLPPHGVYCSTGTGSVRTCKNVTMFNLNISNIGANGVKFNDAQYRTINDSLVHDLIINNTGVAGAGEGLDVNCVLNGRFYNIVLNNSASYCINVGGGNSFIPAQFTNFSNITMQNCGLATINFWNSSNILFSGNNYLDDVRVITRDVPNKNLGFNESTSKPINVTFSGHTNAGNGYVLFNGSARKDFNYSYNVFGVRFTSPDDDVYNISGGALLLYDEVSAVLSLPSNGALAVGDFFSDGISPWFVESPVNLSVEFGDGVSVQFNASDDNGSVSWSLNDTSVFNVSQSGLFVNVSSLGVGVYFLNLSISDVVGNVNSSVFFVNVSDTVPPVVVGVVNVSVLDSGSVEVQFNASDLSGVGSWWLNDSSLFGVNQSGFFWNNASLVVGTHWLNLSVNDSFGNVFSVVFYVVVGVYNAPTGGGGGGGVTSCPDGWFLNVSSGYCVLNESVVVSGDLGFVGGVLSGVGDFAGSVVSGVGERDLDVWVWGGLGFLLLVGVLLLFVFGRSRSKKR